MKKFRYISLLLCFCLFLQSAVMPVLAAETTQTQITEETVGTGTALQDTSDIPFGSLCIQSGCRTIDGMEPLGGTGPRLDTAQSVFLYEVNSDTVVYSYNADTKVHPGTLAKLVLALIVLENCDRDETVVVTEGIQSYIPAGVSDIDLKSLEELSVNDLLHAVMLEGANDAAVALAHHVAGTSDAFVTLMNNRVKQMGCTNTEFGNLSGLYTAPSYSTARDMAKIVREAIKNEDFAEIFGTATYTIGATNMMEERDKLTTTNYLIDQSIIPDFYDTRVTGGYQSYHETTGASVVCTATNKSGDMSYIAVVLGAIRTFDGWKTVSYGNFNEVTDLLEYGFNNYKVKRIIYDGMSLSQFTVAGGESNAVGQAIVNIDSVVPISAQMDNLRMSFKVVDGGLSAPVKKDQLIATMSISYLNSVIAEAEVYAMGDVKAANNTGVTIHSVASRSDADASGFLSVLGTICVIVLGLVGAYLAYNSYMRSRIRAQRRRRRQNRRRTR